MRILFLNWKDIKNPEAGGAEIVAFTFAKRLSKEGNQVTFFSRSFSGALSEETLDGVDIIRRGGKFSVYFAAYLYICSLKIQPDKIIDMINTICWQTPLYVSPHKRIAYLNQLAQEVFFYQLSWPFSWIAYYIEKFQYITYKNTKFLCYSQSTKDDLISYGIAKKNITIFPMGLDHKRHIPKLTHKTKYPLFIFVGRLVKMKRADACIHALQIVIKDYPQTKLAIIGNGPDEKNLHNLVRKLSLEKNVYFVNKQHMTIYTSSEERKVAYMQQAWSLILPSVKEGWGMVVTEAAACGTPSIVSNVTGLRDAVEQDKTGIILSQNPSPEEIARALVDIIRDKDKRMNLGKNARQYAQTLSWEKSYQEFKKNIL